MTGKGDVVAAVDFGSRAVRVLIGRRTPEGIHKIIGSGDAPSNGCVNFGAIQDIGAAAKAFREAFNNARQMCNERILSIYCGIQGNTLKSNLYEGKVQVENALVRPEHLKKARDNASLGNNVPDAVPISCIVSEEWLVDNVAVADPLNMRGNALTGRIRFTQLTAFLENNLRQCIENERLNIAGFVFTPLASAYGCLFPEDKTAGVAVVNLGATGSGIVVYQNGKVIEAAAYQWGAGDIINDVSAVLRISTEEATELVMDYGINLDLYTGDQEENEHPAPSNDVPIKLLHTVTGAPTTTTKRRLDEIIFMRAHELADRICRTLNDQKLLYSLPRGIVLTGGGASIMNLDKLICLISGVETRIGTPVGFAEIADAIDTPEWTAVTGILNYGFVHTKAISNTPKNGKSIFATVWEFINHYIF